MIWTDDTVTGNHYLCSGYISVEMGGQLVVNLSDNNGTVFLMVKDGDCNR